MDNEFYDNWLLIGEPENKYKDTYPIVPIKENDVELKETTIQPSTGYLCTYANPFRNSNSYMDLGLQPESNLTLKQYTDIAVDAIYTCDNILLLLTEDHVTLYDPGENKSILSEYVHIRNGTPFITKDRFNYIDEIMFVYSSSGNLTNRIDIPLSSDAFFHEAAIINNHTILSGYCTDPLLPPENDPFSFIESITEDGLSEPKGDAQIRDIDTSKIIAYFDDVHKIPLFLENHIAIQRENMIYILSLDLYIVKALENSFVPDFISADFNSVIYALGSVDNLVCKFTLNGDLLFQTQIAEQIGLPFNPPLISQNEDVICAGRSGIAAFNSKLEPIWYNNFFASPEQPVHALLYNDLLTICSGPKITVIDQSGSTILEYNCLDKVCTTPLIKTSENTFYFGTNKGLCCLINE